MVNIKAVTSLIGVAKSSTKVLKAASKAVTKPAVNHDIASVGKSVKACRQQGIQISNNAIKQQYKNSIKDITGMSDSQVNNLYRYLPKDAQINFDELVSAGKKSGFLTVGADGKVTAESLKRFLTKTDKVTYEKMLYIEQNFKDIDKASFKKILGVFDNKSKIIENNANINRWLKQKEALADYAKALEKEGIQNAQAAAKDIEEVFGVKPEFRGKGFESLYDKLSTKVMKKGRKIDNLDAARNEIGDLVGTRLVLKDVSPQNMQRITDNICKGIESGKIKVTEIHNYSNGAKKYFTEEQLEQIQKAAARRGYEIPKINAKDFKDPKDYKKEHTSQSGYVCGQMNITHSNKTLGELQIRSDRMNKYAEWEHTYYDLKMGKNLGKNIPELERFYKPVEDAVLKLKRTGMIKQYDKYIMDCYRYLRKFENGKIAGEFRLPKYPKGLMKEYSMLEFDNLGRIHDQAEKIKKAAQNVAKAA